MNTSDIVMTSGGVDLLEQELNDQGASQLPRLQLILCGINPFVDISMCLWMLSAD